MIYSNKKSLSVGAPKFASDENMPSKQANFLDFISHIL